MMKNYDVKEKFNRLLELLADHSVTMLDGYDYVSMEIVAHEIKCIINSINCNEDECDIKVNKDDTNISTEPFTGSCNGCKYQNIHWYAKPCCECEGYSEFEERED